MVSVYSGPIRGLSIARVGGRIRRMLRPTPYLGYLFVLLGAPAQAAESIRLATHDQAPYGTYMPDKRFDGIAVRAMECVLKKMGQRYSIEVFPWERAQVLAQRGEVQGFFPATIKAERLEWAEPSKVIADQKWVWYLPLNSKLDPLSNEFKSVAKVGAHFGSNRLKMLEAEKYNVVLRPQTDELLLLAFKLGRADAILGGDLAMAAAMKEHQIDPKSFRTVVAQDSPLHAYFGKQFLRTEPNFLQRFDSFLPECR